MGESLAIMSQMVAWTSVLLGTVACSDLDCSKSNGEKCQELPSEHQETLSPCRWWSTDSSQCPKRLWNPLEMFKICLDQTWSSAVCFRWSCLGREVVQRSPPGVPSKLSCSVMLFLCLSYWSVYKYSWISQNWGPGQVQYMKCMVLQFLFGTDFAGSGQNYLFIVLWILSWS